MKRPLVAVAALAAVLVAPSSGRAGPACGQVTGIDDLCPSWSAVYDTDAAQSVDMGWLNAVSPDGQTVYSVGRTSDVAQNALDWRTIAYDAATGEVRWTAVFDGNKNSWDWPGALALSPDGSTLYVGGTVANDLYLDGDYGVVAYDTATGASRWETIYDHNEGGVEELHGLEVSADGTRVYLTGENGLDYAPDSVTVAVDTADGDVAWAREYSPGETKMDFGVSVAVGTQPGDQDRHVVYVTGVSTLASADHVTIAYDHDGDELWIKRIDGGVGEDYGLYNVLSPDGSTLYVTGDVTVGAIAAGWDTDWRTYALDTANGDVRWSAGYSGGRPGTDRPMSLALAPDGSKLYVSGVAVGHHDQDKDIPIVAYHTATGEQDWVNRIGLPHSGSEWGVSLDVSPDGSTLAMGGVRSTGAGNRSDAVAELYETGEGTRIKVSDYFWGPTPIEAAMTRDIAFSPAGDRLFITGHTERYLDRVSAGLGGDMDMFTAAYDLD